MKIFVGQTKLTLYCETKADLSTASIVKIKFIRPDASTGEFTGTVSGTKIAYDVTTGDLNQAGSWTFWPHIVFNDARILIGESVNETIYTPGE